MSAKAYHPKKLFTVEEANKALPLVRAIVADLAGLSRDVVERRQRLDHLTTGRDIQAGDPYDDELAQMDEELKKDTIRLQGYVDELQQLGVEPKNGPQGLVDFPSLMDGEIVFLCWKLGETEVLHWHRIEDGYAGRQPLTAGSVPDDGLGGGTLEV
jgi:hypothetical protein